MEFRGMMGGLYKVTEWIMRLSVINVLWVICSSPFFMLVLIILISPSTTDEVTVSADFIRQWLILLAVVAPFTLVPATAAMFTVARKWVTGDEDVPLLKTFFRGYKENYLYSLMGGFVFVLLAVILYVNYTWYGNSSGYLKLLSFFFILLMILLMAAFFNFFSIMVHLHMKFIQVIKNCLLITIGNPFSSFALLIVNGVIVFISFKYNFLVPFFMGSLIATSSFWQFHRNFLRIQSKLEKLSLVKEERKLTESRLQNEETLDKLK